MGNACRKSNKIYELEQRLSDLENIDRDDDGVITKDELELWKKQQAADLEKFRQEIIQEEKLKHQKQIGKKEAKINKLELEVATLKKMYDDLKAEKVKELADLVQDEVDSGALSEKQIRLFVEELLDDDSINIDYFPDYVEKKIYINVFNLLLGLLNKTVGSTSIKFMGHEITMKMKGQS